MFLTFLARFRSLTSGLGLQLRQLFLGAAVVFILAVVIVAFFIVVVAFFVVFVAFFVDFVTFRKLSRV